MDILFKMESSEIFTQVLEDILDNLYDLNHTGCHTILDPLKIRVAKEDIKNIILDTQLNKNELSELLKSKYCNYDERVQIFMSILEKKKSDLLNITIIHYNCTFGETLNTYNWKIKLVCGTSELKTLSYSLLQLALTTVTTNHQNRLRLHEFRKDELLRLIATLEEFVGVEAKDEITH